ncbi:hypothetical protein H0H92_008982 [Tricholoma furcatifolium]|nr:hypothetical protein H0H92_008982 [Tricholoma furcatifolium]
MLKWIYSEKSKSEDVQEWTFINGQGWTVTRIHNQESTPKHSVGELAIGQLFSSEPLTFDSNNHCTPILQVLRPTETNSKRELTVARDWDIILVMPYLLPTECATLTIGEAVEHFRQIFEGLKFMHDQNVVHGDIISEHIMADSSHLFASPPHPVKKGMRSDLAGPATLITSRTEKPAKYYFVDFTYSEKFSCKEEASRKVPWGSNKTVPEWHSPENTTHCNPFPVDVYCMGHYISSHFVDGLKNVSNPKKGFEFMRNLVDDMMNKDPQKRPTMEEVVARFEVISRGFSNETLWSEVVEIPSMIKNTFPKQEDTPVRARNNNAHWAKKRLNKWLGIPTMPSRVVTSDSLSSPRVGHVAFHAPKVALPWYCSQDIFPGQLGEPIEVLWREHYTYLEHNGYTLPPRYRPGAWLKEGEDRMPSTHGAVIHATCDDDTQPRMLKLVCNPHVHEDRNSVRRGVGEYGVGECIGVVSTEGYYPNERKLNFSTCDLGFMVMPYLQPIDNTLFETIGGVVEYFRQIFEGLKFMHDQNVVHGLTPIPIGAH